MLTEFELAAQNGEDRFRQHTALAVAQLGVGAEVRAHKRIGRTAERQHAAEQALRVLEECGRQVLAAHAGRLGGRRLRAAIVA